MKQKFKAIGSLVALGLASLALASSAQAGVIVSAVSGTILSGGPGFGTLTETFDQSGLSAGYTSGVTDFETYIASGDLHTNVFDGFEWFSNSGTTSASVYYDLGSVQTTIGMALWNEETSGIGSLDLYGSTDASTWTLLLSGLTPTDNPLGTIGPSYLADVFSWSSTALQYIRLDMTNCPQPVPGTFDSCAIGEVAFHLTGGRQSVPAPATLGLLGAGLVGLAGLRRRKAA